MFVIGEVDHDDRNLLQVQHQRSLPPGVACVYRHRWIHDDRVDKTVLLDYLGEPRCGVVVVAWILVPLFQGFWIHIYDLELLCFLFILLVFVLHVYCLLLSTHS